MVWVKFTGDFRYKPTPTIAQYFPKGLVHNVTTPCAEAAYAFSSKPGSGSGSLSPSRETQT